MRRWFPLKRMVHLVKGGWRVAVGLAAWLAAGLRRMFPETEPLEGVLVARGTGGKIELCGNRITLTKGGAFGVLITLLGIEGGFVERTIRVSDISAVEFDSPVFFFHYVRFSYPGAPQLTGRDTRDMMAENVMLMSLIDNRMFYVIKERIERSMDEQILKRAA